MNWRRYIHFAQNLLYRVNQAMHVVSLQIADITNTKT